MPPPLPNTRSATSTVLFAVPPDSVPAPIPIAASQPLVAVWSSLAPNTQLGSRQVSLASPLQATRVLPPTAANGQMPSPWMLHRHIAIPQPSMQFAAAPIVAPRAPAVTAYAQATSMYAAPQVVPQFALQVAPQAEAVNAVYSKYLSTEDGRQGRWSPAPSSSIQSLAPSRTGSRASSPAPRVVGSAAPCMFTSSFDRVDQITGASSTCSSPCLGLDLNNDGRVNQTFHGPLGIDLNNDGCVDLIITPQGSALPPAAFGQSWIPMGGLGTGDRPLLPSPVPVHPSAFPLHSAKAGSWIASPLGT